MSYCLRMILSELNNKNIYFTSRKYFQQNISVIKNLVSTIYFQDRFYNKFIITYQNDNVIISLYQNEFPKNHLAIIKLEDKRLKIYFKINEKNNEFYKIYYSDYI